MVFVKIRNEPEHNLGQVGGRPLPRGIQTVRTWIEAELSQQKCMFFTYITTEK